MLTLASPFRLPVMAARWLLGLVFLVAGSSKVADPWVFVHTVEGYNMLPSPVSTPFGLALPWVEVMLGLYLIVGLFTRASAAASVALYAMFLAALAVQIARGHTRIGCGCVQGVSNPLITAFLGGDTIGYWDLLRDGMLISLSVLVYALPRTPLAVDNVLGGWGWGHRDSMSDTLEA